MFFGILFPDKEGYSVERCQEMPACFGDLNLDQIFAYISTSGLAEFLYTPLKDAEAVKYRQDVMRELEDGGKRALFKEFSESLRAVTGKMTEIRKLLSYDDSSFNNYLTRGRMLDCASVYCGILSDFKERFNNAIYNSEGLREFRAYFNDYCASEEFLDLGARIAELRDAFAEVHYCMLIRNNTIRVRKYEDQPDHSQMLLACFEKFRQGAVRDYRYYPAEEPMAEHIEASVLDLLARLYKDVFSGLDRFCEDFFRFDDEILSRFAEELQFYLSWQDLVEPLRDAGLAFCYPEIATESGSVYCLDSFDMALATLKPESIIPNDFKLDKPERLIVITGPNQGGKTTYARAFGQIHYMAALGLCVPGREGKLKLFDEILTHFGREEDASMENGKLQDDLIRLRELIDAATDKSVVIVNEIFVSTTMQDALLLGGRMMDAFVEKGVTAAVVTFLDELAQGRPETVSMMSTVADDDPAVRTFKIVRKPPDGLAYAMHIAGKYGLTYEQLAGRLKG